MRIMNHFTWEANNTALHRLDGWQLQGIFFFKVGDSNNFGMALETNQLLYAIGVLRDSDSDIRWR